MTTMTCLFRSCFSVCWLPLDDQELTSPRCVAAKSMRFNKSEEKNFNSICNNNLSGSNNKCNSKKHVNNPIIKDKDVGGVSIEKKLDHSSWSLSADEEYIVFCFGNDVAQEKKGVNSEVLVKGSRPVNRKLKYGMDEKERVMVQMETQKQRDNITRRCHVEGIEGSAESRNSDQSEGSRSSFAFPVLAWEWIGSPVQMPKSEGLHLRKHKFRTVTFQCCRF